MTRSPRDCLNFLPKDLADELQPSIYLINNSLLANLLRDQNWKHDSFSHWSLMLYHLQKCSLFVQKCFIFIKKLVGIYNKMNSMCVNIHVCPRMYMQKLYAQINLVSISSLISELHCTFITTNESASVCIENICQITILMLIKCGQRPDFWNIERFWLQQTLLHSLFLYYIKGIDSNVLWVCSVIDHTRHQNVVGISVTHLSNGSFAFFFFFFSHFDVICTLIYNNYYSTYTQQNGYKVP